MSIIDRCKTSLISMIAGSSSVCPRLINSLYFDFQKKTPLYSRINVIEGITPPDDIQIVNTICTTLYQNVEDFLNTQGTTWIDDPQILCHFAAMFVSPIVQEHWKINYPLVWYITAQQIDNIINVVNTYKFKSAYELETFFIFYSSGNQYSNLLGR